MRSTPPTSTVDPWVQRFVREALPRILRAVQPERVILFGSRVWGTARPESDLDVVVVSEAFQGKSFFERMPWMLWIAQFDKHVDFFCYTPQEFERIQTLSAVMEEAVQRGWHLTPAHWAQGQGITLPPSPIRVPDSGRIGEAA